MKLSEHPETLRACVEMVPPSPSLGAPASRWCEHSPREQAPHHPHLCWSSHACSARPLARLSSALPPPPQAKAWRMDKYLRRLEAVMIVVDEYGTNVQLTGTGDVLESEGGGRTPHAAPSAALILGLGRGRCS
eukprot:scaffold13579_cov106-Isochrysis_galbana.AAC.1